MKLTPVKSLYEALSPLFKNVTNTVSVDLTRVQCYRIRDMIKDELVRNDEHIASCDELGMYVASRTWKDAREALLLLDAECARVIDANVWSSPW